LPALVHESLLGLLVVLDEAIAIRIARTVDPGKCLLLSGPKLSQSLEVAARLGILANQYKEQRCGSDAAVIEAEGNLPQIGHFARAHFMQDFARRRVRGRVEISRLQRGQAFEHSQRKPAVEP